MRSRAVAPGSRPFLLNRVLYRRSRPFLLNRVLYLRSRPFLLNRVLYLWRRPLLLDWRRLPLRLHRPCCLDRLVGRPRQLALLDCCNCDRLTPFDRQGLAQYHRLRPATVHRRKLRPVGGCPHLVLLLDGQRGQTGLAQGGQFRRSRGKIHATTPTAIAHAVVRGDIGHVGDVGVVNDRWCSRS